MGLASRGSPGRAGRLLFEVARVPGHGPAIRDRGAYSSRGRRRISMVHGKRRAAAGRAGHHPQVVRGARRRRRPQAGGVPDPAGVRERARRHLRRRKGLPVSARQPGLRAHLADAGREDRRHARRRSAGRRRSSRRRSGRTWTGASRERRSATRSGSAILAAGATWRSATRRCGPAPSGWKPLS